MAIQPFLARVQKAGLTQMFKMCKNALRAKLHTKRKTGYARALLLVLPVALTCFQAWFLLHTLTPQKLVFRGYGLYETLFYSSEVTILFFELFYLLLYLYSLLRFLPAAKINQAKEITFLLFAGFLLAQTAINSLGISLESLPLFFLAGKNLFTLAVFAVIAYAEHRISGFGKVIKEDSILALLIFAFFWSIYVIFAMVKPYPFMDETICIHLFFVFVCLIYSIGRKNEKKKGVFGRILKGLCILALVMTVLYSLIVIPPFIFSQHHRILNADCTLDEVDEVLLSADAGERNVIVCENEDFYFFFPLYNDIRFAVGSLPSKADKENIMVIPTAFIHAYELGFSHDNIEGIHADAGNLYQGGDLKDEGAFTYANGQAELWNAEEAEAALKAAAEQGGCGYQQFMVLEDGEITDFSIMGNVCFRVITKWKDRICIIDAKRKISYADFCEMLKALGIKDALYCDMGTGWNFSWYRKNNDRTKNLFSLPWLFSHAWLVFRK